MKSALIAVALAFGVGVSATITIKHNPDGSFSAIDKPDAPAAAHGKFARSVACSPCRDKCAGAASVAPEFCESFLAATYTAPADFAPLETVCASDATRASSACSCFVTPVSPNGPFTVLPSPAIPSPLGVQLRSDIDTCSQTPSTSTTSTTSTESSSTASATPTAPACNPPGGDCTITNFITACCRAPDGSVGCYFPTGDPNQGICFN